MKIKWLAEYDCTGMGVKGCFIPPTKQIFESYLIPPTQTIEEIKLGCPCNNKWGIQSIPFKNITFI